MAEITPQQEKQLLQAALDVQDLAYAPYSHYHVGAAILLGDGSIAAGCNVENAAYPVGICAERAAASIAVSSGQREFVAIAVVTPNGGTPCGMCRQFLSEFNPELPVYAYNGDGILVHKLPLNDLLLHAFGPKALESVD
ncbi:MAG: cytidine deaminase [Chloroflexi bacterium]|nr:cytidine deaminase [Chloroflexota bacterium]